MNALSLYIHIPFCSGFCDYCDFYSISINDVTDTYIKKYIDALIADINYQIEYFDVSKIPTVYIGGGTPSVLGKHAKYLFENLKKMQNFSPLEFTVEANPESLTEDFLDACIEGGVNRLSLGVQTFHEVSRNAVNRKGGASLENRLALAYRYFPEKLSADIIAGLPYQSKETVLDDIKRLLDFNISHISLYSLITEADTVLAEKINKKEIVLPDTDTSDSIWLSARDTLINKGLSHYEISNFARPGKECLHNIRYWRMEGWMGAGAAASGTVINENGISKRFTYSPDIDAYIEAYIASPSIKTAACEELDREMLVRDFLLMGYRYCNGPDNERFERLFGRGIEDCIPQTLLRWENKNKMLFLTSFLTEAFNELDQSAFES